MVRIIRVPRTKAHPPQACRACEGNTIVTEDGTQAGKIVSCPRCGGAGKDPEQSATVSEWGF